MRRIVLIGGVFALLLTGCSSNSFVGRRVDNFTAYYNAFYNARSSFDEGVRALQPRQETRLDRTRYLDLFPAPGKGNNAPFEKAIVKSADILREHPQSKWADDALLLIGKSYFYTGQYVGAEQKFREIIYTLSEEEGRRSPLEPEARFWLARTLVANEAYDRAAPFLDESLALDGVGRRWRSRYVLVQADLYVQQGAWDAAAVALREGIEETGDRDLRARAFYLLGQVEETRGQHAAAVEAYGQVARFNPTYDLQYAAELSAIRVQGQHIDPAAALEKLRRMERDGKNYEFRNELRYVRGLVLQAAGRPDDAFRVYDDVLYSGDGDVSTLRGQVHYALGTLYRDVYVDYLRASAHFDTAATALPNLQAAAAGREEVLTLEAIQDAPDLKTTFATFRTTLEQVETSDSLLALGTLPPDAFAARIRSIREEQARVQADEARALQRLNEQRAFGGQAGRQGAATGAAQVSAAGAAESGFLSFRDPVRVRDNRNAFAQLWGDRPLVDNWRRGAAISGAERVELEASLDPSDSPDGVGATDAETVLPQIDLTPIPRTIEAQALMRTRRAAARYQLGNVLFLNMNRPDSAAAWYRLVLEQDRDEPVAPRAYYALAEVQMALGDSLAAEALYREALRTYPTSDFAGRIRERLGVAEAVVLDSSSVAQAAYQRARSSWLAGAYPVALDSLMALSARYPSTATAPQALYAAGALFLEWAQRDSLDVLDARLPVAPDRLKQVGLLAADSLNLSSGQAMDSSPDSTGGVTARALFEHVAQTYVGTPYAERARRLAQTLQDAQTARAAAEAAPPAEAGWEGQPTLAEQQPPASDETPEPAPEEEISAAEPVTTGGVEAPVPLGEVDRLDTTRRERIMGADAGVSGAEQKTGEEAAAQPQIDRSDPALFGEDPVEAGGGYTIIVGAADTAEEAEQLAAPYRSDGFRIGILEGQTGEGGAVFRVGLGQFASPTDARVALGLLQGTVPSDAWVYRAR